jgi:transitional endoplasmic reticulum ATPase
MTDFAFHCARNVHSGTSHRALDARVLCGWFAETSDDIDPDFEEVLCHTPSGPSAHRPVSLAVWRRVGKALAAAGVSPPSSAKNLLDLWLDALEAGLALDPMDRDILALILNYQLDHRVERLFDALSRARGKPRQLRRDVPLIALLLKAPDREIDIHLAAGAKLRESGLLRIDWHDKIESMERLTKLIRRGVPPSPDLQSQLLGCITAEALPWEAFAHLGRVADVAAAVLRASVAGRETGVNILLYGPPGTGKTSFASALAARIGARLCAIVEEDEDGDEPERHERLAGLQLAQRLFANNTVLLFDEAEDLFAHRSLALGAPATHSRVFIHRLMERVTLPVIWTANDIGELGPAVLRRMTLCLELKIPDLAARTRLWQQIAAIEGLALAAPEAARLARLVPAAPAVASTALRATRLAGGDAQTAHLIVEGVARAVAGGRLPAPEPALDTAYDPALVSADCDLARLLDRLAGAPAERAVSLLLSGPPGSGKSAWARHLAARMGLPVMHRRASDLLNPYVGGTERNIADTFTEARDTAAFLIFDEADSLLLDRTQAVRGWEISQVNEMLTWMEQHSLPFACTTNLPDRLDRASLRRFVVKIRFDWLTQSQARRAFQRFFAAPPPDALDRLSMLTPADFALVQRHAAILDITAPPILVSLLAAECEGRVGTRPRIGFTAAA